MIQKVIGGLNSLTPDIDVMCDVCEAKVATWVGLTFQGTYLEPPEYVVLCDEHGSNE